MRVRTHRQTTFINLGTSPLRKSAAIPSRARIQSAYTFVSLNSRLESHKEEDEGQTSSKALKLNSLQSFERREWIMVRRQEVRRMVRKWEQGFMDCGQEVGGKDHG